MSDLSQQSGATTYHLDSAHRRTHLSNRFFKCWLYRQSFKSFLHLILPAESQGGSWWPQGAAAAPLPPVTGGQAGQATPHARILPLCPGITYWPKTVVVL
jgi:hypothetical protein